MATGLLVLAGCSSSDDNNKPPAAPNGGDSNPPIGSETTDQLALVATRAADYGSGRVDRISLEDNTVTGSFAATGSDISVTSFGPHLYQMGRSSAHSITKYDPTDTANALYQVSVVDENDESDFANPHAMAFVDSTKAYLTRRGSDKLWIVNPSADVTAGEDFKIGEIDLGAYDTELPYMTNAIIVDDKLFVLMERLTLLPSFSQIPDTTAFIAVFDTRTDTEIETNQSTSDLKGIELLVRNPGSMQYNEETGEIYVVGRGNYYESDAITDDFHSGGIEVIDPTTYEHSLLIDDGTDEDNNGYFYAAEVVNANLGYLLTYAQWGQTTLRTFNPTLGTLNEAPVEGFVDIDITTIEAGPDEHLWVGVNNPEAPGFKRLNISTGEVAAEVVRTELVPIGITFVDVPKPE